MFLLFLYWTLIIGVFVTICSVSLNYYRYLRNQLEALLNKTTEEQSDITVTIHDTTVRGNDLLLPINDLLYVEAQKNNVSVCYVKEGKTTTTELHTTLAAVLDDLQAYQNIFQCHRSFVVNLNNITSAQGNSNGYQLKMGKCPTTVPVSRTYVPKLRSYIA
jgi:DNA-binding LytR/AlgR family response regulator